MPQLLCALVEEDCTEEVAGDTEELDSEEILEAEDTADDCVEDIDEEFEVAAEVDTAEDADKETEEVLEEMAEDDLLDAEKGMGIVVVPRIVNIAPPVSFTIKR